MLHLLAWVSYVALVFTSNASRFSFTNLLLHYGPILSTNCLIFYLNYFYWVPKVLARTQLLQFVAANTVGVALLALLVTIMLQQNVQHTIIHRAFNLGWFMTLAVIIRFSSDWYANLQSKKETENVQLKTELSFLKAQINPHFLFNALNNLYALALKKSDDTPNKILQVSSIMRYLLYETNEDCIRLSKEIEIIQTYISLHELRNKSGESVHFEVHGPVNDVVIQPLLFLPLVENVFKHGTYPIAIRFDIFPKRIEVQLSNNILEISSPVSGGVGLQNLKRRLDLLHKQTHQLVFNRSNDQFTARLTIDLIKRYD
ncbi:sensor histidine kinase [Spirosoma gilvum]